jgi:hypothetical protein
MAHPWTAIPGGCTVMVDALLLDHYRLQEKKAPLTTFFIHTCRILITPYMTILVKLDQTCLQEKKASLTAQFEKLTAADGASGGMVSEEEWRQKYEAMKAAVPQYKKLKKELGDIEVGERGTDIHAGGEVEMQSSIPCNYDHIQCH